MKKINIIYLMLIVVFLLVGAAGYTFAFCSQTYLEEKTMIVGCLLALSSIPHLIIFLLHSGFNNIKKLPYFILSLTGIIFGVLAMYIKSIKLDTLCLIWGIFDIVRALFEIYDVIPEVIEKKYLECVEIGVSLIEIVIATLLIIDRFEGIKLHYLFLGNTFIIYFVKYIISLIMEKRDDKKSIVNN